MVMQWALVGVFVVIGLVAACAGLSRVVQREYLRRVTGASPRAPSWQSAPPRVEASSDFTSVVAFPTDRGEFEVTGLFACPCFYQVGQQIPVKPVLMVEVVRHRHEIETGRSAWSIGRL